LFDFSFSDRFKGSLGVQKSRFRYGHSQNVLVYRQKIVFGVEECKLLVLYSAFDTQQDLRYLPPFDSFIQYIDKTFKRLYWVLWNCIRNFHSSHAQASGGSVIPVKNAITEEDLGDLKGNIRTLLMVQQEIPHSP